MQTHLMTLGTPGLVPPDSGTKASQAKPNIHSYSPIMFLLFNQSYAFIRQEQLRALAEKLDSNRPKQVERFGNTHWRPYYCVLLWP